MTYTIPPDSPKALKAAVVARELRRAVLARDIPLRELTRATGVGHTAIDSYLRGVTLPRADKARLLANALRWPRLAELVREARTFACARSGCPRTFLNETGTPRRYCSAACQQLAERVRRAARHGRSSSPKARSRRDMALRAAVRIADERAAVLEAAVAAMCRSCEPDGLCHLPDCDLRHVSPLPLDPARVEATEPRTGRQIRREAFERGTRQTLLRATRERWARPGERDRQAERTRVAWRSLTPEQRAARGIRISVAKRKATA